VLEPSDSCELVLGIHVIEVEDDDVGFAAINAGMFQQESVHDLAISGTIARATSIRLQLVVLGVAVLVLLAVIAPTRNAIRTARAPRNVLDREFRRRLHLMPARAHAEDRQIGHRGTRDRGCGPSSAPFQSIEHLF